MRLARADRPALVLTAGLALTAARSVRLARFGAAVHRLPHALPDTTATTRVSAVVPARDEEANIASCVEALCRSGPDLAEVIVVDDASSDATAVAGAAAGDARLRVIASPGPRRDQLGKPVACAAGAAGATGEWLWFLDCDVRVENDLLVRLLRAAEEGGADVVSAVGRLVTSDPFTRWLLPEVGLAVARRHDPAAVAEATAGAVFAAGHCLLVRRTAYDAVGGHLAIAGEVVDDVALARLVKSRGGVVLLTTAFDGYLVRMYDDARTCWLGLLKNTSAVRSRPLVVELLTAALCLAPIGLLRSRSRVVRATARGALAAQVAADVAARAVSRQALWPAVLAPLVDTALAVHHLQAEWLRRRGRTIAWRGRDVPVG